MGRGWVEVDGGFIYGSYSPLLVPIAIWPLLVPIGRGPPAPEREPPGQDQDYSKDHSGASHYTFKLPLSLTYGPYLNHVKGMIKNRVAYVV